MKKLVNSKKFVASYSGGKDSILAICRAINLGMEPVSLINTYNDDRECSWFHGIPEDLLKEVSASLNIPIKLIKTTGLDYAANFEKELKAQKEKGAEVCVFGDIDLAEHLEWCTARCNAVGLEAFFPLWQEERKNLVEEFIKRGFTANITIVDTERLSEKHLGMKLSAETVASIIAEGADPCGENGEYHTFVSNGPLFGTPVSFRYGEVVKNEKYAILPVMKF
ncbi:MAG: diphthine--ammonia ligase [Solirubrobacterales bacterium]